MSETNEMTKMEKIYSKLASLKKEAGEDIKINKGSLDSEFTSQQKVIKWLNKRSDWNQVFAAIEAKRKETWKKAYEYYRTDYPLKLNNAEEYRMMIESDPAYSVIFQESIAIQEVITYIDAVIEAMKGRAWEVSNLSKYLMWSGGNQ